MFLASLFFLISLCSLIFLFIGSGKNVNVYIFLIWQIIVGIATYNNYFTSNPTHFPFVMLITIGISLWLITRINMNTINQKYLLFLHILRISVEYALLMLYLKSKIPVEMTFLGWNFDILIGLSALLIFIFQAIFSVKLPRKFLFLWNIIGLGFLLFIVSIAVLSSPIPIQKFGKGQPSFALLELPFYLLPTCIVPTVLISHILYFKILYNMNDDSVTLTGVK